MSVAEEIFKKVQILPESAQKTVLDLVDKLTKQNAVSAKSVLQSSRNDRLQLPLIDSREPGVLNITNADIEELLA
jgi:hypothetical protein